MIKLNHTFNLVRAPGADDVSITITHCGVCYADVIWTRNKFGDAKYPLVPGYVNVSYDKTSSHLLKLLKCLSLIVQQT